MIGTSVSHYLILERIGIGGMGVVYKAEDTKLGRRVAIKFLPPELTKDAAARRRFIREAHAAAKLDHPNICTVYDVGEDDEEQVWIAMACYEGETLKEVIRRGDLSVDESIRIARQIADGLSKAHASGIVHRDIKPENVIVTTDGVAKILDFGLAKNVDTTTLTSPGALQGTLAYMSPEQIQGGEVDTATDVWSLGVVLYEMLSGSRPYKGEYLQAVAYSILNEKHVPLCDLRPDLPDGLARIVETMLEKDRASRYPDGEVVVEELDAISGTGSTSPSTPLTRLRTNHQTKRHVARVAFWIAVVAVALITGMQLNDSSTSTPLVTLPDNIVLGVLPFQDISEESLAPQIGEGFAHAMSAGLSGIEGLQVVSAEDEELSAERTIEDLCRRTGINILLRGTLQRSGETVRATWTIVNPTGRQLGGSLAEAPVGELLRLQDTISRQLLDALSRPGALPPVPETKDAEFAEDRYLQALGYMVRYDEEPSIDSAIGILETLGDAPRVQAALGRACFHKFLLSGRDPKWSDRAQAACAKAASIAPDDPDVHRTLGEIYTATSKFDDAKAELDRAIELRPEDADVRLAYADLLDKQGREKEAEEEFRRAIALRPRNWAGHNKLGTFYWGRARLEEALTAFRKAESLTPDNTYVISNIGVTLLQMGRFDEAIAAYERSIHVRPTGATYNNLGTLLYFLGRYDDAADAFERATAMNATDYQYWFGLGDSLRWSSKGQAKADSAYRKAIELAETNLDLNPRDPNTLSILAVCQAKIGSFAKAVSTAELAVETAPDDPSVCHYAGIAMEVAGKRERAVELIQNALELGYTKEELRRDPELEALVNETDVLSEKEKGV